MPKSPAKSKPVGIPEDVAAIRKKLKAFLDTQSSDGRKIGGAKYGVYAFFDYDDEPIYVGQTYESLRSRIGRHLTNQRTDPVAMNVLDPFEVAKIEMWPLWDLEAKEKKEALHSLNAAEYTVFQLVLTKSSFKAVLNEKDIAPTKSVKLPPSYAGRIIPDHLYSQR